MAIEQTTVICECGNCNGWDVGILCPNCNDIGKIAFDQTMNAYCVGCNSLYEGRENEYFDSRFLKLAIDKWFKQGWLLHETVINGVQAILTLRKSV